MHHPDKIKFQSFAPIVFTVTVKTYNYNPVINVFLVIGREVWPMADL